MDNPIKIAIDAMGGDNSPEKVIKGIEREEKRWFLPVLHEYFS